MIRLFLILLLIGYIVAYFYYSGVDRTTCYETNMRFGGESLSLEGYCIDGNGELVGVEDD